MTSAVLDPQQFYEIVDFSEILTYDIRKRMICQALLKLYHRDLEVCKTRRVGENFRDRKYSYYFTLLKFYFQ